MTKSLAISGHFRPHQKQGGVASFFQNLLRGIEAVSDNDPRFRDLEVTIYHGPGGAIYTTPRFQYRELRSRFGRFGADVKYGLFQSGQYDASLFPNYFCPPIVRSRRTVAVIHDLIHLHIPELLSARRAAWLSMAQKYALKRCDNVVTISQAVKDDVCRSYGSRWADKIRPIWNPIAFERLDGVPPSEIASGRPYLLGVAMDRPHKNLATLIRAYDRLRGEFPDLCLVLAGELRATRPKDRNNNASVNSKMPSTVDLVRELGLTDHVRTTGFVSDAQLGALYRDAEAFVLPSLFEGFGMPAVEAMAMGAATIVSDSDVLREVTLGRAHYIPDPTDIESMAATIAETLRSGAAARPSASTVADVRQLFHPATIAKQYLETIFELPAASTITSSHAAPSHQPSVGAAPSATP